MCICFAIFCLSFNDKSQWVFKVRKNKQDQHNRTTVCQITWSYRSIGFLHADCGFIFNALSLLEARNEWKNISLKFILVFHFRNIEPESFRRFLVKFRKKQQECQPLPSIRHWCAWLVETKVVRKYIFLNRKRQETEPDRKWRKCNWKFNNLEKPPWNPSKIIFIIESFVMQFQFRRAELWFILWMWAFWFSINFNGKLWISS